MPKKHVVGRGSRANALLTLVLKGTGTGKEQLSQECKAHCLGLLEKTEKSVLLHVLNDHAADLSQYAITKAKGTPQ